MSSQRAKDQYFTGERDLGQLKHVYRGEPALPLLGVVFTAVWLVILAIMGYRTLDALLHPATSMLPFPLWAMVVLLCAGILLLLFSARWTGKVYHNRTWRILLYEQGIVEEKRSGSHLIPMSDVRYLRHSVPYTYNTSYTDHYSIEGWDGQTITFTASIGDHSQLFEHITRQVTPSLLAQARASYQAGQDVLFDALAVNTAGIKITRTNQRVPWHEVMAVQVQSTGKVLIKRKGASFAWFHDFIPNAEVFRSLAQELLTE